MLETLREYFSNLIGVMNTFTVFDFLDICLVTVIIYSGIKFIRQTRAFQLVKGLILLSVAYLVIKLLHMQASTYLMSRLFNDVVIVVIFIFQPEIRHALESVGRSKIAKTGLFGNSYANGLDEVEMTNAIECICRACSDMSDKKIGALIVCEKETMLGEIMQTGSILDAVITTEMIENIFFPKAPLHDGAAIIRAGRVAAAGCILPLTDNPLSNELGTRHRAGVGMSEKSDAMVIIVSEETGAISIACGGQLSRGISDGDLRERLLQYFIAADEDTKKSFLKKLFSAKSRKKSTKEG